MSNPLTEKLVTGTVGELIVQLRLLQFDVQASPPLKDTGNDLIAIRRNSFRTIQIKTSAGRKYSVAGLPKYYSILAAVQLHGYDNILNLEATKIYLIHRDEIKTAPRQFKNLGRQYELSEKRINELFGVVPDEEKGAVLKLKGARKGVDLSAIALSIMPHTSHQ
jgi:hypothetical protein